MSQAFALHPTSPTTRDQFDDSYSLTAMQKALVLQTLDAPNSGVNIEQTLFVVSGQIDQLAFRTACERIIERHAVLRTTFEFEDLDDPRQLVHRHGVLQLREEDWRSLSGEDWRQRLDSYLQEDRESGFDLTLLPLLRVALFRFGETDYVMIWTFHRALLDRESLRVVLEDLYDYYTGVANQNEVEKPKPRAFRDHVERTNKIDPNRAKSYWRSHLKGFSSPTPLPQMNRTGEAPHGFQEVSLTETVTRLLTKTASDCKVSLQSLVRAGWVLLLSRYSREADVVLGMNRICRQAAVSGTVGSHTNLIPIRQSIPADLTIRRYLLQIHMQESLIRANEQTPLSAIQQWCGIPSSERMFDSTLTFDDVDLQKDLAGRWKDWNICYCDVFEQSHYPLSLSVQSGERLQLKIDYDRGWFEEAVISSMLVNLEAILTNFASGVEQRVSRLPTVTETERRQILTEWNNTKQDWAKNCPVHELFERQVQKNPDAIALIADGVEITYDDLNKRSNRLAHHIISVGIRPGTLVGLSLSRSIDLIVGLLGILKAGAAYVPLDPTYPEKRLTAMIDDSRVPLLVTDSRVLNSLPTTDAQIILLDSQREIIDSYSAVNPPRFPPQNSKQSSPAYVIYTSGSTGKPKGVVVEHRSLSNYIQWATAEFGIATGDRILQFASISFDTSAEEIFCSLTTGATLVLRTESMLNSTSDFLQSCADWRISVLDLPTAFWHDLTIGLRDMPSRLPESVRLVIIGGEQAIAERVIDWQRIVAHDVRLINTYGPTEATIVATFADLTDLDCSNNGSFEIPVGRPVANVQAYILDHHGQLTPQGVVGELHIGGLGLARGYLNRPDLTTEKFIPNPFSTELRSKLYRTGDLARYLPDGNIQLAGRSDAQVKINGYRIETGEVETVLRSNPNVRDVAVVCREDVHGQKRLVAYIIPSPAGLQLSMMQFDGSMRSVLRQTLPAYMHPSFFVRLETFPLTPNGKIDRKALPQPSSERVETEEHHRPRDPLERQLAEIWEDILNVRPIGIRDDFFDLGGHSLLSVRMIDRVERTIGKKIPLSVLFDEPTIEHLSAHLIGNVGSQRSSVVNIQPGNGRTPFFFFHGDYNGGGFYCANLAKELGDDLPFYAVQPFGLDGDSIPASIEAMAATHLNSILAVQANGPYLLGGYCNGAAVAFEIARQLERQGQRVELLLLLGLSVDSAFHLRLFRSIVDWSTRMQRLGRDTATRRMILVKERLGRLREIRNGLRFSEIRKLRTTEAISFFLRNGFSCFRELAMVIRSLSETHNAEQVLAEPEKEDRHTRANEAYRRALLGFVPKRYHGSVTLLWPRELNLYRPDDPTCGWGNVARDVTVRTVPGGHITCLTNNLGHLARAFKTCIDDATAGHTSTH